MKIFVIGFNKTGTCSIHYLFKQVNINSIHTDKPIFDFIDKYDAFSDGDHYNFEKYYEKYPDSLFILNTRPIYNWLVSRYKHAYSIYVKETLKKTGKCWCWPISDNKTNGWIRDRENHYKKVFSFFANKPKQLLIINIEKEGFENVILEFIGKKTIRNIVAKKNIMSINKITKLEEIKTNVVKCLSNSNYKGNELILNDINVDISVYNTFL